MAEPGRGRRRWCGADRRRSEREHTCPACGSAVERRAWRPPAAPGQQVAPVHQGSRSGGADTGPTSRARSQEPWQRRADCRQRATQGQRNQAAAPRQRRVQGGGARQVVAAPVEPAVPPEAAAARCRRGLCSERQSACAPAGATASLTASSSRRLAAPVALQARVCCSRGSNGSSCAQAAIIRRQGRLARRQRQPSDRAEGAGRHQQGWCIDGQAATACRGGDSGEREASCWQGQAQDCVLPYVLPHRQVRAARQGVPLQVSWVVGVKGDGQVPLLRRATRCCHSQLTNAQC